MTSPHVHIRDKLTSVSSFVTILAICYGTWLFAFWPGIFGLDSFAVLWEVQDAVAAPNSGKTRFYQSFVKATFGTTLRVEAPILFQLVLAALVLGRICAFCWDQGWRRTAVVMLLLIALAPQLVSYVGALYPDGVFAVASAALLFELWLSIRRGRVSVVSLLIVVLVFPFALWARSNGAVLWVAVVYALWRLRGFQRIRLAVVIGAWCVLALGLAQTGRGEGQSALFPLTVFETVNFMQPRPMFFDDVGKRVSEKTLEAMHRYTDDATLLGFYDRSYWDTLVYREEGPRLGRMTESDRRVIVEEFFRHNVWKNLPAFWASRLHVFLFAALAEGQTLKPEDTRQVLRFIRNESTYRAFDAAGLSKQLERVHAASHRARWVLWTPFIGIGLLLWLFVSALARRQWDIAALTLPMVMQLGGIFLLSSAGEYRYLLPFFVLPMALMPMLLARERSPIRSLR